MKEKEAQARRIAVELQEAEDRLKNGKDIYEDQESIEFYTMKRNTEMKLQEERNKTIMRAEEYNKKLIETRLILKKLEKSFPDYSDRWIDVVNAKREETGLPLVSYRASQFKEYDGETIESLESKLDS